MCLTQRFIHICGRKGCKRYYEETTKEPLRVTMEFPDPKKVTPNIYCADCERNYSPLKDQPGK